jgi:hypothetical protein
MGLPAATKRRARRLGGAAIDLCIAQAIAANTAKTNASAAPIERHMRERLKV